MHTITWAGIIALLLLILRSLVLQYRKSGSRHGEMPGPRQVPLIGRIHDLPITFMWLKFKEWADIHGPIYRTTMLGTELVIISDESIAEDLLVKKAKINSDRPSVRSLGDSKSTNGSMEYLPLMGRNLYWARQRRWTHASLTEAANFQYYGVIEYEVKRWMYRLLTEPEQFNLTLEDMASKITCTLTWDNPDVSLYNVTSAWGLLTQMSPAGPITNVITPLWNLPFFMNPWKIAERKRHDEQQQWWMDRLQETRHKMELGTQRPCWTEQYLRTAEKQKLSGDYEASSCIGMLALVGVFTIGGPLSYFLVAMVQHPEWQKRCQEEIDLACGDKMPLLDDSPNLPTLRACIKETMRWRPNVPSGVAHETEEDQWYNGYFISKGTRLLPLDWAFLRNPTKYPDPNNFRPERWLDSTWPTYQEPLSRFPTIKGLTSFGWGQRACLGQTLTQDEMLVACASLCWLYNMQHKVNPSTGQKIQIDNMKSNSLLIIKPDPYEMSFIPRSEKKAHQIVEQWKEAEMQDRLEREDFIRGSQTKSAMSV